MLAQAAIRQYAVGQRIDAEVADQEIVLHYALALRKCIFGSTGRFSRDIDFDVVQQNGFEAEVEQAFDDANPYFGIRFTDTLASSIRSR